jgi:hypothetical protein
MLTKLKKYGIIFIESKGREKISRKSQREKLYKSSKIWYNINVKKRERSRFKTQTKWSGLCPTGTLPPTSYLFE